MKFVLEIELGNEGMRTYEDIIGAIVAASSGQNDYPAEAGEVTTIHDINGNTVGKWEVRES